jgi:hypothetical protein
LDEEDIEHEDCDLIHVVYHYTFSDEAARLAGTGYTFVPADVGRVARQNDTPPTFWILLDDSPLTWRPLDTVLSDAIPLSAKEIGVTGSAVSVSRADHRHPRENRLVAPGVGITGGNFAPDPDAPTKPLDWEQVTDDGGTDERLVAAGLFGIDAFELEIAATPTIANVWKSSRAPLADPAIRPVQISFSTIVEGDNDSGNLAIFYFLYDREGDIVGSPISLGELELGDGIPTDPTPIEQVITPGSGAVEREIRIQLIQSAVDPEFNRVRIGGIMEHISYVPNETNRAGQVIDGELISYLTSVPDATTSVKGIVELATSAETTAGLAVQASDTRLSDIRTPSAHAAAHLSGGSDPIAAATTTARGTVELATDGETASSVAVQGSDGRLANARTPTAHTASHAVGGSDPVTPLSIGAPTRIHANTADKTVANTVTETSLLSTNTGSKSIASASWAVGRTVAVKLWGHYKNANAAFGIIRLKLGATLHVEAYLAFSTDTGGNSYYWEAEFNIVCRVTGSSGKLSSQGKADFRQTDGTDIPFSAIPTEPIGEISQNISTSNSLDVTWEWETADAGNSITCTNATITLS